MLNLPGKLFTDNVKYSGRQGKTLSQGHRVETMCVVSLDIFSFSTIPRHTHKVLWTEGFKTWIQFQNLFWWHYRFSSRICLGDTCTFLTIQNWWIHFKNQFQGQIVHFWQIISSDCSELSGLVSIAYRAKGP